MAPIDTPFDRVFVSKISAGIIQLNEPQVNEKETWYTQFVAIKAHPRECCTEGEAFGNEAIATVTMMKQRELIKFPIMSDHRRPTLSMKRIVASVASVERMLLMP